MFCVSIAALLLLGGCGPYEAESGQALMLMAPLITFVGAVVAFFYARAWEPLVGPVSFCFRPSTIVAGLQVLACAGLESAVFRTDGIVFFSFWLVGSSYLALQLLMLRFALRPRQRRRYSQLSLCPWLLLYPPALYLAYFGSSTAELGAFPGFLWILPGYFGILTGVIGAILLIELIIRRRLLAKRLREQLPKVPTARIHN